MNIHHNTVQEWRTSPPLEKEQDKLTARRATVQILKNLDELIKDKKYLVTDKPKFEFDSKKVAKGFCDTYINEDIGIELEKKSKTAKSHDDSARVPSSRSISILGTRRQTMLANKEAR